MRVNRRNVPVAVNSTLNSWESTTLMEKEHNTEEKLVSEVVFIIGLGKIITQKDIGCYVITVIWRLDFLGIALIKKKATYKIS